MQTKISLILILIIAAFFRLYKLDVLPPGLHPDEAANGLDIIRMMDNNDFRVFYNTNGPREALFFYLQGIFVLILGFTQLALRLTPALIGIITVWGLYLLTKEWLDKNAALMASFFLSVSSWHVQFSRNGFRAIMVPLILVFLFYFLTKAIRSSSDFSAGKVWYFILTGIFFALGFYTYLAYLMILPMIFFFIIYLLIFQRGEFLNFIRQNRKNIILGLISAIIIYLPLGIYFFNNPADFLARSAGTSVLNPEFGNPLELLSENFQKAILMFNFVGDQNYRHNYNSWPTLDPIIGIFFILGSFLTLFRLKQPAYFFVFLWLGFMLSPTILSAESIPHSLRAVGTIPVVYLLSIIGLEWFFKYLSEKTNLTILIKPILIIILIFSLIYSYNRYFVLWAASPETFKAYDNDINLMAKFLNNQPIEVEKYAIIFGYSNHQLAFLTHDKNNHPIEGLYGISGDYHVIDTLEKLEDLEINFPSKYLFVIQQVLLENAVSILKNKFPDGELKTEKDFSYYTNM